MSRIDCLDGTQRLLIEKALQHCSGIEQLAHICDVHPRTVRDWRREKHRMSYEALQRVSRHLGLPIPVTLRVLPEFWHIRKAGSLGGQRRFQLYGGVLGSFEGRRKGGLATCAKFKANPALARAVGFQQRKVIIQPQRSPLLAEFIGILLGDGCLCSRFQVSIAFNTETDRAYGFYLQSLFRTLFDLSATIQYRPPSRGGNVVASSRTLVEYLQKLGLVNGNKVLHQVDVPEWIWTGSDYQQACLRGLMDTDGSVYSYQHTVYGRPYTHTALCFTNRSYPLLDFVEGTLKVNGYRPTRTGFRVYLYRRIEIGRYFSDIGTHNSKHATRYQVYAEGGGMTLGEVAESG